MEVGETHVLVHGKIRRRKVGKKITSWFSGNQKRTKGRKEIRWADDFGKMLEHRLFHRIADDRKEWSGL